MLIRELFPAVTYWFVSYRHYYVVNLGAAMCSVALGLIAFKLYQTQDGTFRLCLLWYFGSAAAWMLCLAVFYHPIANPWLPWVTAIPVFVAQLRLSVYFLLTFGMGRRKSHRLPDPTRRGNEDENRSDYSNY